MAEKINIYCKNNNRQQMFDAGVSLLEVYQEMGIQLPCQLVCAKVNNITESLSFQCYKPKDVEFIGISHPTGIRTYVRSLCFVLAKAVRDLFPEGKLYIEHALSKGYYCEIEIGRELTREDVSRLKQRMQEIIAAGHPFLTYEDQMPKVIELFRANGMEDKAILFETIKEVYSKYNVLDGYVDYFYGCLTPSSGYIKIFDVIRYNDGFLLCVPNRQNPEIGRASCRERV